MLFLACLYLSVTAAACLILTPVRARVAPDQQGRETVFDGGPLEGRLLVQAGQSAVAVQVAPERLQ